MKFANELKKSLESPMMEQSKSDEEVRIILDNPEGITIEELQEIEKIVENYKAREKLSEDENKRKLLTYIRKVYAPALSEITENLFSTAADGTERAKIFPSEEREELFTKISNLKKEIQSLTKKKNGLGGKTLEQIQVELNKIPELEKGPTPEQLSNLIKENTQLQQQIADLQQQSNSLKIIINKLPGLIGEKGEIDEKELNLLNNFLAAIEILKSGEEPRTTITVDKDSSYEITNSSERLRLENELAEKIRENKKIIEKLSKEVKNSLKEIVTENQTTSLVEKEGGETKKSISTGSKEDSDGLSEKDKKLIQDIANEFAEDRLEGKTIKITFENLLDLIGAVEVYLDEDTISVPNKISTLEFVKNRLPEEEQKKLDEFIKVETNLWENAGKEKNEKDAPEYLIEKLMKKFQTNDGAGEWEPVIEISKEKAKQLEKRKLTKICDEREELRKKYLPQVLQSPKDKVIHEQLKEASKQTKLALKRRNTEQVIANALADKGAKNPVEVKKEELLEERHKNYSQTLDEINDPNKMDRFKEEILQDVKLAGKAKHYLSRFRKLQLESKKDSNNYYVFLNKADEFHSLKTELRTFIEQEELKAQIEQSNGEKETTNGVDLLEYKKGVLDDINQFVYDMKSRKNLPLPNDEKIQAVIKNLTVPNSRNFEALKAIRDDLFRKGFETINPDHGLSPEEIDDGGKIPEYKENGEVIEKDVNVLVIDRTQLLKAYDLLKDISSKKSLHDIPELYKQTEIDELAKYDNKLPAGKKSTDIINSRTKVRDGLWFFLTSTDERDKGITKELLDIAEKEEENVWEIKKYDPLTPEVLNEFLNTCEKLEGKVKPGTEDKIDEILTKKGGFKIDADITAKEKELPKETKGTYQLPLFYEMNNYDKDNPDFCQREVIDTTLPFNLDPENKNPKNYTEKTIKNLTEKYFIDGDIKTDGNFKLKGHLAIGTGVGKTTKTINCLVYMMKKLFNVNVILVCPTGPLAQSAYNHHKSWLQKWGCVVHQKILGYGPKGPIYESHGSYKVELNKLVDGLSIMEPKCLAAHLAATLCDTSVLDKTKGGDSISKADKDAFEANVKKIKDYKVTEGTLIVFDEADFTTPDEYQELIRDTIILNNEKKDGTRYRVLKMSATFQGKKFSLNSTYPIESYQVSGFASGTELKFEDKLSKGKTLVFLKSIDNKQMEKPLAVLKRGTGETGNGVCHVVYDSTYEAYMEGISFGLPPGAVGFGDPRYGRGFTPDIQNTISTGLVEVRMLGEKCKYKPAKTVAYPLAEAIQQRGRGVTISTKFKEAESGGDLVSDMVKAIVLGEVSKSLSSLGMPFSAIKDTKTGIHMGANAIRAGVALRMIQKNGVAPAPEEMLVGLQGLPEFPTYRTKYTGEPDPDAPKLDVERAKDLLKLMIQTYISNDPLFPQKLDIKMASSLVKETGLTEPEARQVLNALIVQKIKEIEENDKTYDPVKKQGKNLSTIQEIAALHRVVLPVDRGGTETLMRNEKNEDGDEIFVLRMRYNVPFTSKKSFGLFDEKLEEIRNLISGEFKGRIKEEADKALIINSLEEYLELVKKLSEPDLYNELVEQKYGSSAANKLLYRIEGLAKEAEMLQLGAGIEVA
ncbi:9107_t:CDS:10 [Entrophospora sp. SA101]|nr:9107_t:CDS:10 [Entrophospora sp. SA101]